MGHRVPNHKSKCKNFHGHRYRIIVAVDDKIITTKGSSDEGMVIDFTDLKEIMMKEINELLDHGFMIYIDDEHFNYFKKTELKIIPVGFIPTVENITKFIYQILKQSLEQKNIKLKYIEMYETPTSSARYEE